MKSKSYIKRIFAVALSIIMVMSIISIQAFAISYDTYDVSYRTQSEDNRAQIRYGLTDSSAGSFSIVDRGSSVEFWLSLDTGWYLEKWNTWFKGGEDKAWASDPSYDESNPVLGWTYTFTNTYQSGQLTNEKYIYVSNLRSLYGDFRIDAVVRPILTVNAGDGVRYQISTNNPLTTDLSSNQVAVVYGNDATVTYSVDNKYVVTDVSANYGTNYSDNGAKVTVNSIKKPATVTIGTRLKQHNVVFNANGGEGSMSTQVFEHSVAQTLTENNFTRSGYTFAGWNTKSDGLGTAYTDKQSVSFAPANDGDVITLYAQWESSDYTVSFDTNGGEAIDPITVTFGEKYGTLPSSSVAGLSGGNKNWYLVDANGNVTETNIKNLTPVSTACDHKLFIKRNVLSPNVSIKLTVPGGISDGYQYYIPGASQRVLTATVNNANTELLSYTYQWYKDGTSIEGATASILTLDGNVADSGTYKVEVTATLKDGTGIVATTSSATGSKEQNVKILHAANTLSYDANGGEGGPQSSYTGGTSLNVSKDEPTREHYDFIGWNTKADGSGDSYQAKDAYTFTSDGGNGGCTVTLYAQWKAKEYTVTYMADGQTVSTEKVEYGKDATLPTVPHKDGYVGKWDSDGKKITADTEINAVYTINKYTVTYMADGEVVIALEVEHGENVAFPQLPKKDGYVGKWHRNNENITSDTVIYAIYTKIDNVVPDEFKTDDKTDLEDTKKQLEDMLDDNSYTEDEKKAIEDAIDDIDKAFEAIENVEAVEELIDKLPDTIKKDDEAAIKAADDAYNALTDYEKSLVDADAKKALDDAKAALAELNKPADSKSPATVDNSNMFLWIALLFISGGAVITLTVVDRKRKAVKR